MNKGCTSPEVIGPLKWAQGGCQEGTNPLDGLLTAQGSDADEGSYRSIL